MKHVLPELISSNQTAYVKNRCISESGRLISDVIEGCDMLDISHNLVAMDIEILGIHFSYKGILSFLDTVKDIQQVLRF